MAVRELGQKRRDRMRDVLSILGDAGEIGVNEVRAHLSISAATLRRDLSELEARGLITRTYGRVAAVGNYPEIPVLIRESKASTAKRAIAHHAARLLPPGPQAVAVSGGTTTIEVIRALGTRSGITILSNAVTIALEASRSPRLKVIITGGTLRSTSLEAVGPLAESAFARLNVSTAFLGADGISVDGGVTTHDEHEARTNGTMVQHAGRVIVVCDGSKVGRRTLAKMADISEIGLLITDDGAPSADVAALRSAGVEVHVIHAN